MQLGMLMYRLIDGFLNLSNTHFSFYISSHQRQLVERDGKSNEWLTDSRRLVFATSVSSY